ARGPRQHDGAGRRDAVARRTGKARREDAGRNAARVAGWPAWRSRPAAGYAWLAAEIAGCVARPGWEAARRRIAWGRRISRPRQKEMSSAIQAIETTCVRKEMQCL